MLTSATELASALVLCPLSSFSGYEAPDNFSASPVRG